jgi:hypothetical protein
VLVNGAIAYHFGHAATERNGRFLCRTL